MLQGICETQLLQKGLLVLKQLKKISKKRLPVLTVKFFSEDFMLNVVCDQGNLSFICLLNWFKKKKNSGKYCKLSLFL